MEEIRADAAHQKQIVHLLHETKFLIYLVKPWSNTWHIVCADSYFYSVPAVDQLEKLESTLSVWLRWLKQISYALLKFQLPT